MISLKANLFRRITLFLAIPLSFSFLLSCGEDEAPGLPPPSISFRIVEGGELNADKTIVDAKSGDVLVWEFTVQAEAGFKELLIEGLATTQGVKAEDLNLEEGATTAIIPNIRLALTGEGELKLTIKAFDNANNQSTAEVTVNITSTPVRDFSGVIVAAPLGDRSSETWFSANTGVTVTSAEIIASTANSADVDFGYYYTENRGASLAAPASFPSNIYDLSASGQRWATLNNTTFRTTDLIQSNFFEITSAAQVETAYSNGEDTANDGIINNLQEGTIIAFQGDDDKEGGIKRGLLLIKTISTGDGENGKMTFDIKIQ